MEKDIGLYKWYSLKSLLCKHVTIETLSYSQKEVDLVKASESTGYRGVVWGYKSGHLDTMYHYHRILDMEKSGFNNAIRIVNHRGHLWCDNLHSTIRCIRSGAEVLDDIPYYIVELGNKDKITVIEGHEGNLHTSMVSIWGAIAMAKKRVSQTCSEIYNISYTVGDFLIANPMLLE